MKRIDFLAACGEPEANEQRAADLRRVADPIWETIKRHAEKNSDGSLDGGRLKRTAPIGTQEKMDHVFSLRQEANHREQVARCQREVRRDPYSHVNPDWYREFNLPWQQPFFCIGSQWIRIDTGGMRRVLAIVAAADDTTPALSENRQADPERCGWCELGAHHSIRLHAESGATACTP